MDKEIEQPELLAPEVILDELNDELSNTTRPERSLSPSRGRRRSVSDTPPRPQKLMVILNEDGSIRFPLYKDEITIGRSQNADIQVHSRYISRVHAKIRSMADSTTVIEDIGSKNGLTVNGEFFNRHTLRDGDLVVIGQVQLQYTELDEAPTAD
jgi:pSer/pThr/pTyr-binding forkhead associated (FHA) protein